MVPRKHHYQYHNKVVTKHNIYYTCKKSSPRAGYILRLALDIAFALKSSTIGCGIRSDTLLMIPFECTFNHSINLSYDSNVTRRVGAHPEHPLTRSGCSDRTSEVRMFECRGQELEVRITCTFLARAVGSPCKPLYSVVMPFS